MPSSHVSPQVCRPHFHGPLSWLSDPPKPIASSSTWGSPFACPQDPQDKLSQVQSSQSGQHLFSFPPTPPKDSTPDSVQTAPAEYQATINAFMHHAQVTSNNNNNNNNTSQSDNCGLDVKPCLTGNGQSAPKQREGTTNSNNNNNSSSANNNSASASLNASSSSHNNTGSSLFDGPQSYGGYDSYGYHQNSSSFQSTTRPSMNSPHIKPQRTKARTSAGKIWTRCGVFFIYL